MYLQNCGADLGLPSLGCCASSTLCLGAHLAVPSLSVLGAPLGLWEQHSDVLNPGRGRKSQQMWDMTLTW